MLRAYKQWLAASLVVLATGMPAFAQGGRAEINGTVYDQDKAVMPGVNITITSQDTGLQRTTVTSGEGRFVVPTLVPGVYTVQAELSGFQTATQTDLRLAVGQELTVNLTMALAGLAENLTVSAQAPIVEVTSSRVGANITNAEIDSLPSAGRNQLSLMQMVPGLVPALSPGDFEGGQFNANGQATSANVFLTDGAYNNDSRRGGSQGTQSAVALDTMAEYQVLTHHYTAEYGGGTGVIVNSVTKSGTNNFAGRVFGYFKDEKLDAVDYRNRESGEEKPDYSSKVFGGNLGGPIIRNKWFFFGNIERTLRKDPAIIIVPDVAYPAGAPEDIRPHSYNTTQDFTVMNSFLRTDVQVSSNHNISFRYNRAHELTERDTLIGSSQMPSAWRHENDAGDNIYNFSLTSVFGNSATNEFKAARIEETLLQAGPKSFDSNWKFIGLGGVDQFDFGASVNTHPDYTTGNAATLSADRIRDFVFEDNFTLLKSGWGGDHTFKFGVGFSSNGARPQTIGTNAVGTFSFPTNTAFDPANVATYPWRFTIRVLGQLDYEQIDHRTNFFVQDKWQVNQNFTLNYGVRYDYQRAVPQQKKAWAPRAGFAWDPQGDGMTVVRAGFGKYFQIQPISIIATFLTSGVITPINNFDTGQVTSPATSGVAGAHPCLNPIGNGTGVALISPACKDALLITRAQVAAGSFFNQDPTLEGDRTLPYLWSFSAGVKRQLFADLAVSVDYTGNRGRDQTTLLDRNVGPTGANGRITRLGIAGMPAETVAQIPASAQGFNFRRVLQYVTDERFNTDFNSLELALEKRHSNRWSGRLAYTLGRARDVGGISDQLNPRIDYGRANTDNRHALAISANVDIWKGLSGGAVFRRYSGYPTNETIGSDVNGDNVNNDRPVQGRDDLTMPILSPVDGDGRAIRNGIDGNRVLLLDGRLQYLWDVAGTEAGLFLEVYNVLNTVNFENPTGNRNSDGFGNNLLNDVGDMRKTQVGLRLTF